MQALLEMLRRESKGGFPAQYAPDALIHGGLEARIPSENYYWDGMKRGADRERPFVVFQVTLEGEGVYEEPGANGPHPIPPGRAFAAVVPSQSRYYLPEDSPGWTFFWIILRHPYVVGRIVERQRAAGAAASVLDVGSDSAVVARAVTLYTGGFPDRFAEEAALFEFLIAYERHVHAAFQGGDSAADAREALLSRTRARVLETLALPLSVGEVADDYGMSRTRFSHHFRAKTGVAPGAFIARVRLEEVARRLIQTGDTLSEIAAGTGFADANHLCKAFRRHFHLSPGAFRRQMR